MFMMATHAFLGMGAGAVDERGGEGGGAASTSDASSACGLRLAEDLTWGSSDACRTFHNPPLHRPEDLTDGAQLGAGTTGGGATGGADGRSQRANEFEIEAVEVFRFVI